MGVTALDIHFSRNLVVRKLGEFGPGIHTVALLRLSFQTLVGKKVMQTIVRKRGELNIAFEEYGLALDEIYIDERDTVYWRCHADPALQALSRKDCE